MQTENETSQNVQQAVPFFGVKDMTASLRFYVDGLGFEMTNKWIDEGVLRWCWLQLEGAAVMLQEYRTEGHDSWLPEGKVGIGVLVHFICRDALEIYHQVTQRGVDASTPFVSNGMWFTAMSDPDGYQLAFESLTDTPEGTKYAPPSG